jgi:oligopeptide/dipeptide ABC transporter ATP-binding protein
LNASNPISRHQLLGVKDLRVSFAMRKGVVNAVDGVSMSMRTAEIVGLVGESGSGKSTLGMAILRLVPAPGRVVGGEIQFLGRDLLKLSIKEMRAIRGRDIALIVQDALAAMNPVTTVAEQIGEVVRDHQGGRAREVWERSLAMLKRVDIPRPKLTLKKHAHELSGGMQQRVAIAGALILGPKLLIADEPTTALDVTVQAQILDLLRSIRDTSGAAVLFISHDLATVAELCDRILVMYAGRIVESGPTVAVFEKPLHPYTQALLSAIPPLGGGAPPRFEALGGSPPDPARWPTGCRFHPRCPLRIALGSPAACAEAEPPEGSDDSHWAACHFQDQSSARWQIRPRNPRSTQQG